MGSHKVVNISSNKTENNQMASIGAIFSSTYYTKQLNPWPTPPASCVADLPAFPGKIEPVKYYPSIRGCLTSLRNSYSKQIQYQ